MAQPASIAHESTPTGMSAMELLTRLACGDSTPDEMRSLILSLEQTSVPDDQRTRMVRVLLDYIEANRDSDFREDLVVVGAAIRKLVANLDTNELDIARTILEAGHRAAPPLTVELEVTKSLVRHLSTQAARPPDSLHGLCRCLGDMARLYTHDRLLPRENYAAVALNATLALLLLAPDSASDIHELLIRLKLEWFRELVLQRARQLVDAIRERIPGPEGERRFSGLGDLLMRAHVPTA